MSYHRGVRKVYYYILEGSRCIFADERNKSKLLDIVLKVQPEEGWLVYAFCLTDDNAYFVIEADGRQAIRSGIQKAGQRFIREWNSYSPNRWCEKPVLRGGDIETLESLQEIVFRCRQIHRLPLQKQYVRRLEDYWWSSYITYAGIYEWQMIDCRVLFLYFSAKPEEARKRLCFFTESVSQDYNGLK